MVKVYGLPTDEVTRYMRAGQITIDIMGLGKMGLPLAALFAREGAKVIGVRRSEEMVKKINEGRCPVEEEPGLADVVRETVAKGNLRATTDGSWAAENSDVLLFLVPLLVDQSGNPDFTQIKKACADAANGLKEGDLVVVETTMPPGSIRGTLIPILEKSGLVAGKDFGVAHAPERLMSGMVMRNMYKYPKIVGGLDQKSTEAAAGLYAPFGEVVRVSSLEAAELVKLSEGIYRDLNIAYANMLALFCEKHGIDVWEVIRAANYRTSDYCHIHQPGSGVGGHCIPIYPWFLIRKGESYSTDVSLLREARRINDGMPRHMKRLIDMCLSDQGKPRATSSVAVLGIAFRGGVKETRLSPGIALTKLLRGYAKVVVNDPMFSEYEIRSMGLQPASLEDALECDCVALVTDHPEYRKEIAKLESASSRIVDGRNLVPSAAYKVGNLTLRPK